MENSFQLNIVLSDENQAIFNKIVEEQAKAQVSFVPITEMVRKTDQEWFINFN